MKIFVPFLMLYAYLLPSASYAEDQRFVLSLDDKANQSYCIYESKLYSEGAVYRTSAGKIYVCFRVEEENKKSSRLIWKEVNDSGKDK